MGAKLIEKEAAATGSVGWKVYKYYASNIGACGVLSVFLFQLIYQGAALGTNIWLSVWTGNVLGNSSEDHYRNLYLGNSFEMGF